MMGHGVFRTPARLAGLCLALLIAAIALSTSACRGCDITGVFNFCNDGEGPHQLIDAPMSWRQQAMDVQRAMYQWTRMHAPADTARFVWRDSSRLIFVRVLKQGIPGGCERTDGDSILIVAGNEPDRGLRRHEAIHWTQPGNPWLMPNGNIHDPSLFAFVGAPLVCR